MARNRRDRGDDIARSVDLLADAIGRATRIHGEAARPTRELRRMMPFIQPREVRPGQGGA